MQSVEVRVTAQRCFLARLFSLTQRYEFSICFDLRCVRVRVLAVVLLRAYCGVESLLAWKGLSRSCQSGGGSTPRLATKLANGFLSESAAITKSENYRINTGFLWRAWADLNHQPRRYKGCANRFYRFHKNLQDRGLPNAAQVV